MSASRFWWGIFSKRDVLGTDVSGIPLVFRTRKEAEESLRYSRKPGDYVAATRIEPTGPDRGTRRKP